MTVSALADYSGLIVDPDKNYKGMSYGDWVARWTNWLFSADPDRTEVQGDVIFLRGNVEYGAILQKAKASRPLFDPWDSFYDRTGEAGVLISDRTSVLVPVITSTYLIGAESKYGILNTEEQVRSVTRMDNDQSSAIWATIESTVALKKGPSQEITSFRVSSRLFKLWISEVNPFWKGIFEYVPLSSGEYDAVTDGFFILIKNLPPGSHRIRFGGKGRLEYRTDSIYDLYVSSDIRPASSVNDILKIPKTLLPKAGGPPKRTINPLQKYP